MTTPCPIPHHLPPHVSINITPTTVHPNPHAISTSTPLPISPLNRVRHPGPTKIRIKIAINTTMAHTPQLAPRRGDDPLHGQSSPLPPQSIQLPTPVPRPGRIHVTADTNNTPPFPPHLMPVLHLGPSYLVTSIQHHKTAETPSVESRRNPELFRMKFLFSFIFHLLSLIHLFTFSLPDLLLCEGTHGNELRPFPIFLRGAPVAVLPSVSATSDSVATYHI
jgi:hypothetical protein